MKRVSGQRLSNILTKERILRIRILERSDYFENLDHVTKLTTVLLIFHTFQYIIDIKGNGGRMSKNLFWLISKLILCTFFNSIKRR